MGIYQKKAHILQNRFIAVVNVSVVIKRGGDLGVMLNFWIVLLVSRALKIYGGIPL